MVIRPPHMCQCTLNIIIVILVQKGGQLTKPIIATCENMLQTILHCIVQLCGGGNIIMVNRLDWWGNRKYLFSEIGFNSYI